MVHLLSEKNSLVCHYMAQLRDERVQKDGLRFRKNLERIAQIAAYEISKKLDFQQKNIQTPLGISENNVLKTQPVIASILRAGLTMHQGLLSFFDEAENAFISAYREEKNEGELKVHVEYLASPDLNGKTLIIGDPMLATGQSMLLTLDAMKRNGIPAKIHIVSAIASKFAIENLKNNLPQNCTIWVAAIDDELNDKLYIVPGLGDAGDLAFGLKL